MKSLADICKKIGEKNNPLYTVVPIALCKGIFRPIFTSHDKKQEPKSRKYAAIREGTTELIAVPTYIGMSKLAEKLAPAFSPNGKTMDQILENSKTTLGFFGVCISAVFVIPALCNLLMPLVLKAFDKHTQNKNQNSIKPAPVMPLQAPQQQTKVQSPYVHSFPQADTNRGRMAV